MDDAKEGAGIGDDAAEDNWGGVSDVGADADTDGDADVGVGVDNTDESRDDGATSELVTRVGKEEATGCARETVEAVGTGAAAVGGGAFEGAGGFGVTTSTLILNPLA